MQEKIGKLIILTPLLLCLGIFYLYGKQEERKEQMLGAGIKTTKGNIVASSTINGVVFYAYKDNVKHPKEKKLDKKGQLIDEVYLDKHASIWQIDDNQYLMESYVAERQINADGTYEWIEVATTTPEVFKLIMQPTLGEKIASFFSSPARAVDEFQATTGDGGVRHVFGASWADCRSGTGGSFDTGSSFHGENQSGVGFNLTRGFFDIDTSALPDNAIITSSTVYAIPDFTYLSCAEVTNHPNITLVANTKSTGSLSTSDWGLIGSTQFSGDSYDYTTWNNAMGNWVGWTMNATGRAAISLNGYTKLGFRMASDYSDATAPSQTCQTTGFRSTGNGSGSADKPKIAILYTLPTPPPRPIILKPSVIFKKSIIFQ